MNNMSVGIVGPNLPVQPGIPNYDDNLGMASLSTSSSKQSSYQLYYDKLITQKILELLNSTLGDTSDIDLNNPQLELILKGLQDKIKLVEDLIGEQTGCECPEINPLSNEQITEVLEEHGIIVKP